MGRSQPVTLKLCGRVNYVQQFLEMDFRGKELRYLQEPCGSEVEEEDAAPSNAETTPDQ